MTQQHTVETGTKTNEAAADGDRRRSSGTSSDGGQFSSSIEFLTSPSSAEEKKEDSDDYNMDVGGGSKSKAGTMEKGDRSDPWPDIHQMETGSMTDSSVDVKDVDTAAVVRLDSSEANRNNVSKNVDNRKIEGGDDIAEKYKRRRCDTWSEFISTFLFFSSSVIYVTMAVKDYQWAQKLLDMPMHIRTADDDISWYNYIIEERHNASLLEEQEAATMSRAGGVRRMKTREHFRRLLELEEEEDQLLELRAHESAQEFNGVVAPMETLGLLGRRLQTPEELYYNLCWAELPREIQDAYTVLGTTEIVWDNGATTELSLEVADSWWNELTDEQLEAASFIGYTQELWNVDENGNPITTPAPIGVPQSESPTKQPTPRPVTDIPTKQPTLKPVTDSPTRRPTRKPTTKPTPEPVTASPTKEIASSLVTDSVTDTESPAREPTPTPVTDSPTEKPTPKPVTDSPTTIQPTSTVVLYWDELSKTQQDSLSLLGYTETFWGSGATSPVELKTWSEMTSQEKYGAYFLGYSADTWDAKEVGDHFTFRPPASASEDGSGSNVFEIEDDGDPSSSGFLNFGLPTAGLTPAEAEDATVPTAYDTLGGDDVPASLESSLSPSTNPTHSPVTATPTSALLISTQVLSDQSSTFPTSAEVTSALTESSQSDVTSKPFTDTNVADPDVPASPTPEELYYDEYWADLPPEIQDAYAVLGLNETMWNLAIPSEASDYWWHELPAEMQEAARFIGYTKEIWCATVTPTASPTPGRVAEDVQSPTASLGMASAPVKVVQAVSTPVLPELPSSSDTGQEALVALDENPTPSSPNTPTTDPNSPAALYYDEYWADLPPDIQAAYSVLGLNETKWNLSIPSEAGEYYWGELPLEMREAALFIGYNEEIWCSTTAPTSSPYASSMNYTGITVSVFNMLQNETETEDAEPPVPAGLYDDYGWAELPPHIQVAATTLGYSQTIWDTGGYSWAEDTFWGELTLEQKEAGALLGYDKYSWDGIDPITGAALLDDDFVSYDDDYLFSFQVGSSDVWVSQYQILYFVAASSFLFVGVLDLIRERHIYHILMIIAGASGVVSAIFIEQNIRVSNVVSSISVHFYLLEALTLFGEHKRYAVTEDSGKWMARSIMIGDATWVLGSLLDVILSYFYLLDDTSDWDVSLVVLSILAALGWLICSIIYLGIFAYDYYEANHNVYSLNDTMEIADDPEKYLGDDEKR